MLHGYGDAGRPFSRLGRALADRLPTAEVLVPDGFEPWEGGPGGRQWFGLQGDLEADRLGRVRAAGERLSAWMDAELKRRGLDPERLMLVGFSQGAMLAGWLAVHRAQRPGAVVMLSGRIVEPAGAMPTRGLGAPVFMAHGDADRVIPVEVLEPGARMLEAAGLHVSRRVYPGMGHAVLPQELEEVAVFLAAAMRGP
jgi:phospholipase/carboxylesterase